MESEEQSAAEQATTEQAANEETAFQEAAALKQWVNRDKPRRLHDTVPEHPFNIGTIDPEQARAILREANTTMVIVAPGLEELRVGTAKAVSLDTERLLPRQTISGRRISYHRIGAPKVSLPASSIRSPALIGPRGDTYCCGSSISVATEAPTGTLGCLIRVDGALHGLTANHMSGLCHHTDTDMPIIGPGTRDILPGNPDPKTLGHHVTCASWRSGKQSNTNIIDNLDLAIFRIKDNAAVSSSQGSNYDTPIAVAATATAIASLAAARDMKVWNTGRTTELTAGRLFGRIGHSIASPLSEKHFKSVVHLTDLLVVEKDDEDEINKNKPFATAGDSDPWWCGKETAKSRPLGFCFCTSPNDEKAFLMPMEAVLGHFGATLVGGHNVKASNYGSGHPPHGAVRP